MSVNGRHEMWPPADDVCVYGSTGGDSESTNGTETGGTHSDSGGSSNSSGGSDTAGSGGLATGGAATGGAATGGAATGGSGTGGSLNDRVRGVFDFNRDWLFVQENPSGAEQASFPDTDWRKLNVPHDWSIEGEFSQGAATTGRGGYLPSGIAWYRKHFSPDDTLSGKRFYIEFDGVMANSDVYVNGDHVGNHPNGYVSFRYDVTDSIQVGQDNVIAVKTDTSLQPGSRYYSGSGIYRHVRLITTDTVHVDQWATYVTTPEPTASAATVHVETSILNSSTSSNIVNLEGNVRGPVGTETAPVTTPAQDIPAGASATFSFDIPVSNPELWSPDTPNMYELLLKVQIDGTTVDDEVTPFGIHSLTYSATTGLSINGKETKFQGVCLHQDYHGLGMAAPLRAKQRRLAQLKTYGVNAVRISHDPPDPAFLDLCDRMGILVMDEFFDVWVGHKYNQVGDYAAYFQETANGATGTPAVPGVAASPSWFEVDVTGVTMRDRNHPSLALYSAGNEIRDSIATRTPILTRIVELVHTLDPSRPVTQALFRPQDNGDIGGATRTLLDVFGGNYRTDEVVTGMSMAPARAGVITEVGTQTSTWTTVMDNPALTGSFMWTGIDYLGEQPDGWPMVGNSSGILDAMGTPKPLAFSWQEIWGAPMTTFSTGAVTGQVTLTVDHSVITTDLDDVAFVRAAVTADTAPVTFSIDGPGAIVAVDSGNLNAESFRGATRNAYGGLAFAIIAATGSGAITVTAKSDGLSDGSVVITSVDEKFIPCSETCD